MDEQDAETTVYNALEIRDLSMIADMKATNPGFSTHTHEYMENCQWCVVAYEARRRGYHVIAKPRILSRADFLRLFCLYCTGVSYPREEWIL